MSRILLHELGRELDHDLGPAERTTNTAYMADLDQDLASKVATTHAGWGDKYVQRVHAKGKLTSWERIDALKDDGSEVFEVGTLVNWGVEFAGSRRAAPGAGVITCFTRIHDRWCMVIANDNTVASGAWWPKTPEKIERAQQMALRLRLPVVYLVDCSGLFLPEQSRSFAGATGAGHIFKKNALLADSGVPQIAGVFGDCIAGGGYMPIISDRVYMTEGAYMVIAGAALIRGAKSLKLTSLDIGGPEVHVHQSRTADVRVPDDPTALRLIRDDVNKLPSSAAGFYRHGAVPAPPRFDPSELSSLFPPDFRQGYDIEQVIARLVDHSLFHEVMGHVGREMVTGLARINGLWVGIIANRQGIVTEDGRKRPGGALYREGIAKISQFSRAANSDGIPVVWLQDISGFDIGVQAERQGLLGYGSNLIYTNSTNETPMFTVLLRKASGAGYYAMAGLPYDPVVQLSTPMTRLSVMEGRTLAIATYNSKLDDDFEIATQDPAERAEIEQGMRTTAARIEGDMDPVGAASRMDTDEVIELRRLRAWLECLVESAWQSAGYRRTKNPRIWSVHDLEVVTGARPDARGTRLAGSDGDRITSPAVGHWRPAVAVGASIVGGTVLGTLERAGSSIAVVAPRSASGGACAVSEAGWVQAGDPLVELGELAAQAGEERPAEASADGAPEGVLVIRAETDGTVYLRPEPSADAFVETGAAFAARATLALVEVMKTFTPVRANNAGSVERILVDDGQAVSEGQPLFWVR